LRGAAWRCRCAGSCMGRFCRRRWQFCKTGLRGRRSRFRSCQGARLGGGRREREDTCITAYVSLTRAIWRRAQAGDRAERRSHVSYQANASDGWPAVALRRIPAPSAQPLRLPCAGDSARSGDGAAFERAVCDAFAASGFAAVPSGRAEGAGRVCGRAGSVRWVSRDARVQDRSVGGDASTRFEAAKYREAYVAVIGFARWWVRRSTRSSSS